MPWEECNLSIDNTELGRLSAASFIFGGSNGTDGTSGDMQINTNHDFGDANVTFRSGGDIDLAGTLTKATGAGTVNYIFEADGNIFNSNSADVVRSDGTINLTADSLNLDASGTISAEVTVLTALDIGSNATGATLTGLLQGAATQTEADLITGGPGDDANYTFEGFTIRKAIVAPPPPPPAPAPPPPAPAAPAASPDMTPEAEIDPAEPAEEVVVPLLELPPAPVEPSVDLPAITVLPSTVQVNMANPTPSPTVARFGTVPSFIGFPEVVAQRGGVAPTRVNAPSDLPNFDYSENNAREPVNVFDGRLTITPEAINEFQLDEDKLPFQ